MTEPMGVPQGNPSIEMEEDGEYRRQLVLFVRSSTEKGIELVRIGELIAGLGRRRSFLDIGAGGGDLTIPEPNEQQARRLRRRCPSFRVVNECWDRVDLGPGRFVFILCSHVLYYIPEGAWLSTIEKMYDHLEPGGCIAVVIQSPMGEVAEFFSRFTRYDVNILGLWGQLIRKYGDEAVDVRYFVNEIYTESLDDMVSIGLFLLIDRNFRHRKDEIRTYFESRHRTPEGYRIRQDEILLAVRK
jgi:SAM-dependent methyltransferase